MDLKALPSLELSRLCVDGNDATAWLEFVRRFQKPIALTALRICRMWGVYSPSIVDDLVQETYLRLCADQCKTLRSFVVESECSDPLAAFVRTIAANVAHDYFRSRTAQKRGGNREIAALELPNEEAMSDLWRGAQGLERDIQIHEIERALQAAPEESISPNERVIFRLYFRQGMTAGAIATVPSLNLSTKGVESAVHRVKEYLRTQLNPAVLKDKKVEAFSEGEPRQFPMKEEGA
jgi:RNA polymerase sigma-70 factor (ECF subfamily)